MPLKMAHLVGYSCCFADEGSPPHHQVGEDSDPEDTPEEGNVEVLAFFLQPRNKTTITQCLYVVCYVEGC